VDNLSPKRRSELMKRVRRADTTPEVALRKALYSRGFRYVIGDSRLPGTPDLVFPKYQAVVFVHGCFWHGHHCRQGRAPSTNVPYWRPKLEANRLRDSRKARELRGLGWRVRTVWECQIRGNGRDRVVSSVDGWLRRGASQ
jgi:DNA mismatch endonuclease, patch repair protein